ncbi:MAG: RNA polymerase sigma factor [Acidobacteria bacterium]|nr:RNA polymerase sigma factor [Acidobacteriota bacterium]
MATTGSCNVFRDRHDGAAADEQLVAAALRGDEQALADLVRRHQAWIYNLALRMVWDRSDAEDATQEILLKIITRLGSFRRESAFTTWAYRIAANHLLNRRRSKAETVVTSFECYGKALAETPVSDETASPEARALHEEVKVSCMTAMLLCLDRRQRLAFVLGEIFEVPDSVGSRIMGLSRTNFRQVLSRARKQLYSFLKGNCGLVDPANPCRCARKTRGFIRAGIVDPRNLVFCRSHLSRVEEVSRDRSRDLEHAVQDGWTQLYRDHPFPDPPHVAEMLGAIVESEPFRAILDLDEGSVP